MIESGIKQVILSLPMVRMLEIPSRDKENVINQVFPLALNQVIVAYDWGFTLDVGSTVTVADQADYTLYGNDNDCRDIINVKYDGELIEKMAPTSYDEYMVDRSHTAHNIWIPKGRNNGFPQITIAATPDTAGEAIEYRYRKKNITLADFPDEFDYVIISAVVKYIIPNYVAQYEEDLNTMIDRYSYGGGESDQIKQDWRIVKANNNRASLYGYGG